MYFSSMQQLRWLTRVGQFREVRRLLSVKCLPTKQAANADVDEDELHWSSIFP